MLNFTKGKWVAGTIYGDHHAVFANEHILADCFSNEDNARLIAAAPVLYALVENLANCQPHQFSEMKLRAGELISTLE